MTNTAGLILSENSAYLGSLTEKRSIAALPFAGRYRLIDFVLSNMVNSGITNVGVVCKYKYSSLMDHLGSGNEWDLNRKKGGLYIIPPYSLVDVQGEGNIDLIASASDFIKKSKQDYIALSNGNVVANMNLDPVKEFHEKNNADVTIVYYEDTEADNRTLSNHTILQMDDDSRVTGIEVRPLRPKTKNVSMSLMLIGREFLQYTIAEAVARGEHNFVKDILVKNLSNLKICGYEFDGYVGYVDSLRAYYETNMDMLDEDIRKEIFDPKRPIYTKIKDQVPTKYSDQASVHNSLIADGCQIEGDVQDSIIFRGVKIAKGTNVSNCIVMQDSIVESGSELNYVILDKDVMVRDRSRLVGQVQHPMIIGKGEVV